MVNLQSLQEERDAVLVLENGRIFYGLGFGASKKVYGEVVFTNSLGAGYNESLTDTSNYNQIHIFTYPLIGNFGVPSWELDEFGIPKNFESNAVTVAGLGVFEACKEPSHFESTKTIDEFLTEQNIPGIEGIDTREVVKILRDEGSQFGLLWVFEKDEQIPSEDELIKLVKEATKLSLPNVLDTVLSKEIKTYSPKAPIGTVVLVDCGAKNSLKRVLLANNLKVINVPYNTPVQTVLDFKPNGVIFSNGPGDPKTYVKTIDLCKKLMEKNIPMMGINLGHQIIALAAGGNVSKLYVGHRGYNKPVVYAKNNRCYITSQNHTFCVKPEGLEKTGFEILFTHLDDKSIEGLIHKSKPIITTQFYPDTTPELENTYFLFEKFIQSMNLSK